LPPQSSKGYVPPFPARRMGDLIIFKGDQKTERLRYHHTSPAAESHPLAMPQRFFLPKSSGQMDFFGCSIALSNEGHDRRMTFKKIFYALPVFARFMVETVRALADSGNQHAAMREELGIFSMKMLPHPRMVPAEITMAALFLWAIPSRFSPIWRIQDQAF